MSTAAVTRYRQLCSEIDQLRAHRVASPVLEASYAAELSAYWEGMTEEEREATEREVREGRERDRISSEAIQAEWQEKRSAERAAQKVQKSVAVRGSK